MFKKVYDAAGPEKVRFAMDDDPGLIKWIVDSEIITGNQILLKDALREATVLTDEVFGEALEFPCKIIEAEDDE